MLRKLPLILFLVGLCSGGLHAQYTLDNLYVNQHRPPGLNWQVLKTDHFRIIYPEGLDSLAYRSGYILEHQYPYAVKLTGGTLKNFPVVLNNYNDLTNGFVTPQNFRSEIDIAPFKGKSINPQSGSWFETVLPHELTHANQGNVIKTFSIPGLMSLMSPDLGRMFNFFPQSGVLEGLAVYQESMNGISGSAGRGNYSFFNNQFNANLSGPSPWSMGQSVNISDYTLPYNRHYIGGYTFTKWLLDTYGIDAASESIGFHQYFFFLGYGTALKHTTGKWPGKLYKEYAMALELQEAERKEVIGSDAIRGAISPGSPYKGARQRGPVWISESEIVFYSTQYNAIRGYYILDTQSGKQRLLKESFGVGDYYFDYDPDDRSLVHASYFSGERYPSSFEADLQKTSIATGKTQNLTEEQRAYAPVVAENGYLALQTDGTRAAIIHVDDSGATRVLKRFEDATPVAMATHPSDRNKVAVVLNRRGVQGLWVTTMDQLPDVLDDLPDIAFKDASVFDPVWHPTENKLLFTADPYPAMNIFEYDADTGGIIQLTNSAYNAMEPSYSPSGEKIAYVVQEDPEQLINIIDRDQALELNVSFMHLLQRNLLDQKLNAPYMGQDSTVSSAGWEKSRYGTDLSWLKPRAIIPVSKSRSGSTELGVSVSSSDVLQSQTYDLEVTGIQDRVWYNATYTNTTFYPGFRISGYSEPDFFFYSNPDTGDNLGLMTQERGLEFSVPFYYVFRDLSRTSALYLSPSFSVEQIRFFDLSPEPLSNFGSQYKAGGFVQLSLGLTQNPRDVQQNSGFSAFFSAEKALNDPDVIVTLPSGTQLQSTLTDRYGYYYGLIGFVSPFKKWNQSLRIDLQALQQSDNLLYSTSTIVPMGFQGDIFPTTPNLARLSGRYTIPLFYPDNGGFLLPLYLRSIYLTGFTHTIADMDAPDLLTSSRTIIGAGLHFQFNISNLGFDIGVGVGYEPSRSQSQFIFGAF